MSMSRRRLLQSGAAGGALAVMGWSGGLARAQQKLRLTVTAGHPINLNWVRCLDEVLLPEYARQLAALPNAVQVEWNKAYGGTVAKLGAESDALGSGVSDLGIVATIFEAGKFPLQQVSMQVPFTTNDIDVVSRAVDHAVGRIEPMSAAWKRARCVPLCHIAVDGYQLMTTFPVNSAGDLEGKKILAPGPIANWVKGTGAIAVAGNLNTYYNDLKTGLAAGVIVSMSPAWPVKLHEVAPHITLVNFGAQYTGSIAISEATLRRLPAGAAEAARKAGQVYAADFSKTQAALARSAIDNMVKAGAKVAEFPDAERKRWAALLPDLPNQWARELEAKGLPAKGVVDAFLEGLGRQGVVLPRNWRA
jgi:TRAP-type C4-dicarboxylate transport system substrate-binding protein